MSGIAERVHRPRSADPVLVLVLEDLHWADESTVLLTEYLAPLLPEMPVLVLGSYRDAEVDLSQPLARVIGQLGHRRLLNGLKPASAVGGGGESDAAGTCRAASA